MNAHLEGVVGGEPFDLIVLQLIVIMVVYGMFVLGTCIAIWPMILSLEKRKIWLLLALILVFISFTWNIANTALIGRLSGINLECTITLCSSVDDVGFWLGPLQGMFEGIPVTILLLVSDIIVVWRAWILLSPNRFWRSILALLTVINIILNILDCAADALFYLLMESAQSEASFNTSSLSGVSKLILNYSGILDLVSISTSLLVNAVATILIGWKAWIHYKSMTEAAIYKRSYALKVLLLFVESGAIFCAIQLVCIVLFPTIQGKSWKGFDRSIDLKFPLSGPDVNAQPEKNYPSVVLIFATAFYPITVAILIHTRAPSPEMSVETLQCGTRTDKYDYELK
ncbi:hypothetical protein BDP27DRAFT_1426773 [Rhodocollybia butyracea]|uniref:Uncharacterized protein n=1 Tax=Rhodocollybia butyracea TaxID=206335 RepID=A0A9P5PK38_9AGAR|nr:hypothetical protein BDP27DRAFT_1426773 [Rhodocollybia butyracea]